MHAPADVTKLFNEEVEKLIVSGKDAGTPETLREARELCEAMIATSAFDPV